jgi:hypothetical protein
MISVLPEITAAVDGKTEVFLGDECGAARISTARAASALCGFG